MKPYLAILLGFALSCASSFSAEPEAPAEQLPRLQATEAKDAFKTFRLKQGFHVELAAAEPEVADPVSMSFDANGRLYVVEMIGYSERRADKVGRVRLLEDTDGDGRFEKATVFAAGLAWPTAVICYDGGVFVVVTPDLLYFRDTDDDGVADQRRVIFTGFGKGRSRRTACPDPGCGGESGSSPPPAPRRSGRGRRSRSARTPAGRRQTRP